MTDNSKNNTSTADLPQIPSYVKECAQLILNSHIQDDEVRDRCFLMSSGAVLVGILLHEIEDSFLVGACCSLVKTSEGEFSLKLVSSNSFVTRIHKASVALTQFPSAEVGLVYTSYMGRVSSDLPEFFNPGRIESLTRKINHYSKLLTRQNMGNRGRKASTIEGSPSQKPESLRDVADFWKNANKTIH